LTKLRNRVPSSAQRTTSGAITFAATRPVPCNLIRLPG
jgi:hypothetical protein